MPEPQDPNRLREIIGAEVGGYLSQAVAPSMTVGLGWAKTLTSGVPAIEPRTADGVKVLSMLGGLTRVSAINRPNSPGAWPTGCRPNVTCGPPPSSPPTLTRAGR